MTLARKYLIAPEDTPFYVVKINTLATAMNTVVNLLLTG